ncbi:unnamed protein product [Ilex paraguariensis]|uniref:HMA domain-containing protein n=1 Tax=Ilex paraguariensis TaxID=185542 RepID=A0ABC8TQQ6_9AQUA
MAPSFRDVQLTSTLGANAGDDLEEVRLLDAYEKDDVENSGKLAENLKRIQVRVTGMTCAACSNSVEQALMSVNGVVKASVALLQNKADVAFDTSLVNVSL